jgi:hypothetical protein
MDIGSGSRTCKRCAKVVAVGTICTGMVMEAFHGTDSALIGGARLPPAVATSHHDGLFDADVPNSHTHTESDTDPMPKSAERPELASGGTSTLPPLGWMSNSDEAAAAVIRYSQRRRRHIESNQSEVFVSSATLPPLGWLT